MCGCLCFIKDNKQLLSFFFLSFLNRFLMFFEFGFQFDVELTITKPIICNDVKNLFYICNPDSIISLETYL